MSARKLKQITEYSCPLGQYKSLYGLNFFIVCLLNVMVVIPVSFTVRYEYYFWRQNSYQSLFVWRSLLIYRLILPTIYHFSHLKRFVQPKLLLPCWILKKGFSSSHKNSKNVQCWNVPGYSCLTYSSLLN